MKTKQLDYNIGRRLFEALGFALQLSLDVEHAERCGAMHASEDPETCDDYPLDDLGCHRPDGSHPCPWIEIKRVYQEMKEIFEVSNDD